MTGIPLAKMANQESQGRLLKHGKGTEPARGGDRTRPFEVISQGHPPARVRAWPFDQSAPWAAFIFLGPTGGGAKNRAGQGPGRPSCSKPKKSPDPHRTCPSYMEKEIRGLPPWGGERLRDTWATRKAGQLHRRKVRKKPYSRNPARTKSKRRIRTCSNILLQILDDGQLTDS